MELQTYKPYMFEVPSLLSLWCFIIEQLLNSWKKISVAFYTIKRICTWTLSGKLAY